MPDPRPQLVAYPFEAVPDQDALVLEGVAYDITGRTDNSDTITLELQGHDPVNIGRWTIVDILRPAASIIPGGAFMDPEEQSA